MESFIFCAVKIETFDDRNSLCADADFEANSKQNLMIMGWHQTPDPLFYEDFYCSQKKFLCSFSFVLSSQ